MTFKVVSLSQGQRESKHVTSGRRDRVWSENCCSRAELEKYLADWNEFLLYSTSAALTLPLFRNRGRVTVPGLPCSLSSKTQRYLDFFLLKANCVEKGTWRQRFVKLQIVIMFAERKLRADRTAEILFYLSAFFSIPLFSRSGSKHLKWGNGDSHFFRRTFRRSRGVNLRKRI